MSILSYFPYINMLTNPPHPSVQIFSLFAIFLRIRIGGYRYQLSEGERLIIQIVNMYTDIGIIHFYMFHVNAMSDSSAHLNTFNDMTDSWALQCVWVGPWCSGSTAHTLGMQMAALVTAVFWLHLCTRQGSRDVVAFLLVSGWSNLMSCESHLVKHLFYHLVPLYCIFVKT